MTFAELSSALATRGLIPEGQQIHADPSAPASSPWYVQVMLGVCAWVAGLLLLAFLLITLSDSLFRGHEEWSMALVLGACVCLGAGFLYATVGETSVFGSQFALALSCAGQVGLALGLGGVWDVRAALWGMLIIEAALVVVMRSRLHRVISTVAAVVAWALATHEIVFGELPGVSIWGTASTVVYRMSLVSVVMWLAIWAPVVYAAYWLVTHEAEWMAAGRDDLLRPVTQGVIAALAVAPLATHPAAFWMALGLGPTRDLTDGSLSATAMWPFLAVLLALVSTGLAFAIRSRPLVGVAIIFGFLDVTSFYYVLGTTLLVKSMIMVGLGAALLAAARWLTKESTA